MNLVRDIDVKNDTIHIFSNRIYLEAETMDIRVPVVEFEKIKVKEIDLESDYFYYGTFDGNKVKGEILEFDEIVCSGRKTKGFYRIEAILEVGSGACKITCNGKTFETIQQATKRQMSILMVSTESNFVVESGTVFSGCVLITKL